MPFGTKEAAPATPAKGETPAQEAIHIDFNEVYDLLIAPALVKADCLPFRADQEKSSGDIRTDMFFELITADVVVADISILNPNGFYELGVRHGKKPAPPPLHAQFIEASRKKSMSFSPDERRLATADADGTIRISWLRPEALIEAACLRLRNNIPAEERAEYQDGEHLDAVCAEGAGKPRKVAAR